MQLSMMMPMDHADMAMEMQSGDMPCSECYSDGESYALKDAGSLKLDPILISATIPQVIVNDFEITSDPPLFNIAGPQANAPPLVGTVILRT